MSRHEAHLRRLAAARRLGLPVCQACCRVARDARPMWQTTNCATNEGRLLQMCSSCAEQQVERNKEMGRQRARDTVNRLRNDRMARRTAHPSSVSYRRACAAMQDDVDAARATWKIGCGFG